MALPVQVDAFPRRATSGPSADLNYGSFVANPR